MCKNEQQFWLEWFGLVGIVFNGIKLECKYLVHLKSFPTKSTYVKSPQILIHIGYTVH